MGNLNRKNIAILVAQGGAARALNPLLGYLTEFEDQRYHPFHTYTGSSIASYVLAAYLSGDLKHKALGMISAVHHYSNKSTSNYMNALASIMMGDGNSFEPIFDLDRIVEDSFNYGIIEYKALKKLKIKFYLTLMEYTSGEGFLVDVARFARDTSEKDTKDLFKAALGFPIIAKKKSFNVLGKEYLDGGLVIPIPYFPKKLAQTLNLIIDQRSDNKLFDYTTTAMAKLFYSNSIVYERILKVNELRDIDYLMLKRMASHGLTNVISGGSDIKTPFVGSDFEIMKSDYKLSRVKAKMYLQ